MLDVELRLLGELKGRRRGLLLRVRPDGKPGEGVFFPVGVQIAPAVHRVPLVRVALPPGGEALRQVMGEHAGVEPVAHVVGEAEVVEVIGHLELRLRVKVGQRVHVDAVEHGADLVGGEGHLHHLAVVVGRAAVDAELDEPTAQQRIQPARHEVLRHGGADDDAVVVVGFGDAGVGVALCSVGHGRDEARRLVVDLEGIDEDDGARDERKREQQQRERQRGPSAPGEFFGHGVSSGWVSLSGVGHGGRLVRPG